MCCATLANFGAISTKGFRDLGQFCCHFGRCSAELANAGATSSNFGRFRPTREF